MLITIVLDDIVIARFFKKLGKKLFWKFLISSIMLNVITNFSLNSILERVQKLGLWRYIMILIILGIIMLVGEALCYQEITNNKKYAWKIVNVN